MHTGPTVVASVAFLALLASPVWAETIRVPQDEATIQDAANSAQAGDTILVSRGVYREQVTIGGKNGLRFVAKGAVWIGNVGGVRGTALTATGDEIVVQGFRFRHGGGHVAITGNDAVVTRCTSERGENENQEFSFVRIDGDGARVERCRVVDAAEPAVHIFGNGATVGRNRFGYMREMGVVIEGDDAVVERNRFQNCNVMAVNVEGAGAVVTRNRISFAGVMGVHVWGDGRVERNTILGGPGVAGICVDHLSATGGSIVRNRVLRTLGVGIRCEGQGSGLGSGAEVVGNRIDLAGKDAIQVETGGATVSLNRVRSSGRRGLFLLAASADVRRNKIATSGNGCFGAFEVHGDGNTLTDNSAAGQRGDGFFVSGSGNTLTGCVATGCTEDGFDVQAGTGNELQGCRAQSNGAEGLDNSGTGTDVSSGTFTRNRIDVANDGTLAGLVALFVSGGETTVPEVDCVDSERGDRW